MLIEITIELNITTITGTTSSIVLTEKCEGFMFHQNNTLDLKFRFDEFSKIEKEIAEQE